MSEPEDTRQNGTKNETRNEAAPETKEKTTRIPRNPAARLEALEAEMVRVRAREEKRLIQAADKAGYFRHRFDASGTLAMFRTAIDALEPRKHSTLAKLEKDIAKQRSRVSKAIRSSDARRKALLGSFLVAQCRHKPELHGAIAADIRAFLKDHPKAQVAERNLALLAGFLANPAALETGPDTGTSTGTRTGPYQTNDQDDDTHSAAQGARAHRLILLGAWVLERHRSRADLCLIVTEELERFLDQGAQPDRDKDLLRDVLP